MPEIGQIPGGGRPFGDIYYVQTPHLDKLANTLYTEQKQREFIRQKQGQALDEEFRKNVASIKDADVPDYTKKYQEWKKSRQELMRLKPKNQEEYIAKQMESQRKLADVYSLANLSKRIKEEEEDIAKDYNKNPNNYDDNTPGYLSARRQLPSSQLNQYKVKGKDGKDQVIDLSDSNTFRYKGSNTDFGAVMDKAIGQPKQVYSEEVKVDKDGRQTDIIPYQFGNTPAQVKDRIMGAFGVHQAGRDAEHQWDTIPQSEKEETLNAFNAIPAEKWKRMGVENPQDITPKNGDSKTEQLASLMAMQYALSNEPKQGTPVRRNNQAAIDERNFQQQKELVGIQDANARRRLAISNAYQKGRIDYRKASNKKEQREVLEGYINRMFEEGKDTKGAVAVKGKFIHSKNINVPKKYIDTYTIDKGRDSEEIPRFAMTADKKYVVPLYPGRKSDYKPPIPIETFRNEMGQIFLTKKDAAAEMDEIDFSDDEEDEVPIMSSPSAPEDDSYTRSELKAAGWKDSQIDEAAKSGKIKLK